MSREAGEGGATQVDSPSHLYLRFALFMVALAAIPFLIVALPPIVDLPQHLDQARLYGEVLSGAHEGVYTTAWFRPQNLIYTLILPAWAALPPIAAGKAVAFVLIAAAIASLFHLAARRERSPEAALAASVLLFNFALYSGLLAWQLGGALFFLWLAGWRSEITTRSWIWESLLLLTMAWAHALWFVMAAGVLFVHTVLEERSRTGLIRVLTMAPSGVWAIPGTLGIVGSRAAGGFDIEPYWAPFWWRLAPDTLINTMFGGIRGWIEPALAVALLVWVVAAVWDHRDRLRPQVDMPLLIAAGLMAITWLVVPNTLASTALLSRRWLPYAWILVLLALPLPRVPTKQLRAGVAGAVAVFTFFTASAWHFHDRVELRGLPESIAQIPEGSRVLGLDFLKYSTVLKGRPFLQATSWAGPLRGASLSISFTELGGLVVRSDPEQPPWTPQLEWHAEAVRTSDFVFFDYVLLGGTEPNHRDAGRLPALSPVGNTLPWNLYRIESEAVDAAAR